MERERIDERIHERDELTVDEWETLDVVELPERELMTGCGGGGGGLFIGIALNVQANVSLGTGFGSCYTSCGS